MNETITTRTSQFYIGTVAYDKTLEDGNTKRVKESYVLDAVSFTEAEESVYNNVIDCLQGTEPDITDISKAPFGKIFFTDKPEADKFYKVKANFITIDERTGKEKKSMVYYLVKGGSTKEAQANFDSAMGNTMIDYSVEAVIETKILDVFLRG